MEDEDPSPSRRSRAAQLNRQRARQVSTDGGVARGYLRRAALLTPVIATISLLAIEAAGSPSDVSVAGADWIVAALFGTLLQVTIGGLVGCLVGLPFTYVLNFIPSAGAEPRFGYLPMLFASAVSGGFCAVLYSDSSAGVPSDTSLERTREG